MVVASTRLMTVAEFRQLPEDDGPQYHELRRGEPAPLTRPRYKHYAIQRRLRRLLEKLAPPDALVDTELPYRPLPEYELRVADVAYVTADRERTILPDDYLRGAPELVVEILSPSNTAAEIYDKEKLCLENGAHEFWVVDPDRRQIKVSTPDGRTATWRSGQQVPLPLFANAAIAVDAVFG